MNPSKQVKTPVADLLDATAAAKALLQSYSAGDFASSAHTHILSDVEELVDALASKYDSSHVGTTANKLVQLTAAAKLPAVDGSLLTNLQGAVNSAFSSVTGTSFDCKPDVNYISGFKFDSGPQRTNDGGSEFLDCWGQYSRNTLFEAGPEQYTCDSLIWGYNPDQRHDAAKASLHIRIESPFRQDSGSPFGSEFHIDGNTDAGVYHRHFSMFIPTDGLAEREHSGCFFSMDYFRLDDWAGNVKVHYNWETGNVTYSGTQAHLIPVNNQQTWKQNNAAGNAYIPLPYIDSSNKTAIRGTAKIVEGGLEITNTANDTVGYYRESSTESLYASVDAASNLRLSANGVLHAEFSGTPTSQNFNTKLYLRNSNYGLVLAPTSSDYNGTPFVLARPDGSIAAKIALYNDDGGTGGFCKLFLGSSDMEGNVYLGRGGGLYLGDSVTQNRWLVYTADSSGLYIRNLTNARMVFSISPGASVAATECNLDANLIIGTNGALQLGVAASASVATASTHKVAIRDNTGTTYYALVTT